MAEDGFVGPYNGSQAREVLITLEDWNAMTGQDVDVEKDVPPLPPKPKRNTRIQIEHDEEHQSEASGRTETLPPLSYSSENNASVAPVEDPYDNGPPFATVTGASPSRGTVTFDSAEPEDEGLEEEELEDEEFEEEEWEEEDDDEYESDGDEDADGDEEEDEDEDEYEYVDDEAEDEEEWEEEDPDEDEEAEDDEYEYEYEYEYEEEEEDEEGDEK
jgi:hypothetical protein